MSPGGDEPAIHRSDPGLRAILQGVGAVRAHLGAELDAQRLRRPMLVCGAQVVRTPAFALVHDTVRDALGAAPLVFDGSRPHSPSEAIEAAAATARDAGVDAIVAVGGSSSIDSAKGIAALLGTGARTVTDLVAPARGALSAPQTAAPGVARVPVLTVTTTLSYAEFYPFWGTRLASTGAKAGYGDQGAVSRTIFLDGEAAACTPDDVWFETAVKSLDDALLLHLRSGGPEPFLDPLLTSGIGGVLLHLAGSARGHGDDGARLAHARQEVLTAMAVTKFPAPRVRAGFATEWFARAVRYALGSRHGLAHGVGTCIAMVPGLAFHRDTAARQVQLARALGAPDGDLASLLTQAIAPLPLPRSLRAVGLGPDELPGIVDDIVTSMPGLGPRAAVAAAVADLLDADRPVSSRP